MDPLKKSPDPKHSLQVVGFFFTTIEIFYQKNKLKSINLQIMSIISIESKVLFHSLRIVANSLLKKFRVGGGGEGVGGGGGRVIGDYLEIKIRNET